MHRPPVQRTQTSSPNAKQPEAAPSASRVQLRGKSFADQEAALAPVQLDGPGGSDPGRVHGAAQQGIASGGGQLPHLEAIQRSFGGHDVSAVQAHSGGAARQANDDIGANAYASGNHIAFRDAPDLHTAAHEAAHVVQQRAGVSLSGGVGRAGDSYEQHADAVADQVVQGKSAEGLLDTMGGGGGGGQAVQRAEKKSAAGTFRDEHYELTDKALKAYISFTPGDSVEADKIAMIQTIKAERAGKTDHIDPAARERTTDEGVKVDRLTNANTGVYGSANLGQDETLADTKPHKGQGGNIDPSKGKVETTYKLGHRKKDGETVDVKAAELEDSPTTDKSPDSQKVFETAALALTGPQAGTYYGSVQWGWKTGGDGVPTKVDFDLVSAGAPSKQFNDAVMKFNEAKVRGTVIPVADDVDVFDMKMKSQFKLKLGDEAQQTATLAGGGQTFIQLKVTSEGANKGKTGLVKVSDVKDKGDGAELVKLPVAAVSATTAPVDLMGDEVLAQAPKEPSNSDGSTKRAKFSKVTEFWNAKPEGKATADNYAAPEKPQPKPERPVLKALAKGTRVKVLQVTGGMQQVEVVDGADTGLKGWLPSALVGKE